MKKPISKLSPSETRVSPSLMSSPFVILDLAATENRVQKQRRKQSKNRTATYLYPVNTMAIKTGSIGNWKWQKEKVRNNKRRRNEKEKEKEKLQRGAQTLSAMVGVTTV